MSTLKQAANGSTRLNRDETMCRILAHKLVQLQTGLSRTTLWRLYRAGEFPSPVRISPGRVGFLADEVEAWINNKRGRIA